MGRECSGHGSHLCFGFTASQVEHSSKTYFLRGSPPLFMAHIIGIMARHPLVKRGASHGSIRKVFPA